MADKDRDIRVRTSDPIVVDEAAEARRRAELNRRATDDDVVRRDTDDVSPHYGGRAQPGDVLGIETGGETTEIGDTPEDENKRRRDSERSTK